MDIETVHTFDTEYSADSIEWCPGRSLFACGTYQLEDNGSASNVSAPSRRKGRIYLFAFDVKTKDLQEVQRFETAAILDMKWLTYIGCDFSPLFATVNALGQVEIYNLENDFLEKCASIDLGTGDDDNLLALSLDWKRNISDASALLILVSDSKGGVSLLRYHRCEKSIEKVKGWKLHNFEAWTCAFDRWNENLFYTGGDDTILNGFDLRTENRTFTNKSHMAGVTSLLSHPFRENYLLTGSYDEVMRIFDTRNLKQQIAELNLSGGIWRLKLDPGPKTLILAACMYTNFSVVDIKEIESPKLVATYEEHKSICYGADWCLQAHEKNDDKSLFFSTCSFYDHKLCVANLTLS